MKSKKHIPLFGIMASAGLAGLLWLVSAVLPVAAAGSTALSARAAAAGSMDLPVRTAAAQGVDLPVRTAADREYQDYRRRFEGISREEDIPAAGFRIIEEQVFPIALETFGEVSLIPAFERKYMRLALFLADADGEIIFKTDQLDTNNRNRGELRQFNRSIEAVSFQDINMDGLTDIALITSCVNQTGSYAGKSYKVGDVLFQSKFQGKGDFYRDYRLSDKINRFGMNKSIEMIAAFIKEGYSTEFLYTASTLTELMDQGLEIVEEQHYVREFEKLGRLQVIPGTYTMAKFTVFMIYLVNEQGYIVWSLQPMGDFDNLYALKGIACRDIDGDGLKDIAVLARYSREGSPGEMIIENDYEIYYQRTGGFDTDTEYKKVYQSGEEGTMEELLAGARAYWGW